MTKWTYIFGTNLTEGKADMRNLLGGKGANLAEMCNIGLPVPPGFTITTEVCTYYYQNNKSFPKDLETQIFSSLKQIEEFLQVKFGEDTNPLLLSVRSGSRASMPGMMDTVLNLGLNDKTAEGLARRTSNRRFAYDSYRRFIQMYSDVVLGVDHYHFEEMLELKKRSKGISEDIDLDADDLYELVQEFKDKVQHELGKPFPQNVSEQLWGAIKAVFDSWMNERAITYRRLNNLSGDWGTAVNVQAMVFGNMGNDCATGVAFTRDPSTGENEFYGEYLINAQGEDVVAGIRTPQSITINGKIKSDSKLPAMEESMPTVFKELTATYKKLEQHYRDMQDIEFTVQNNKLWLLQTRNGKRTAQAAIKIAVDMVNEGTISKEEAVKRIAPSSLEQLLHPTIDLNGNYQVIAKGLPASPGVASGMVVFSADEAESKAASKHRVILVRAETSPEDIHGMHAAEGILTSRGGMTSHAAVVARGMGKCCVCGTVGLVIDYKQKTMTAANITIKDGDFITINGSTGEVILGEVPTIQPKLSEEFNQLMQWADHIRKLKVRANAETKADVTTALKFGAEGIGLCRTEHMFFNDDRITAMREMIISDSKERRQTALAKLLPIQRQDFIEILTLMRGLPVNIRLLDPPLHEFLPHSEEDMLNVAKIAGVSIDIVRESSHKLKEMNPMLGHRGCRLGISYPEIYEMQSRAIFEAMAEVSKTTPNKPLVEIMIPLVFSGKETEILKNMIDKIAAEIQANAKIVLNYSVGTMIELPRAALKAGEIAEHAQFFSFGTNDLTQTTFGMSRDDAGSFLHNYKDAGIINDDPFVSLDESGVGELMKIAVERGRKTRADIKLGICGEHGGHPEAINFCQTLNLDYVSCSPYRIPIAKLAAAHAALGAKAKENQSSTSDGLLKEVA